uniref:Uncharacterized protein n=1 Tax=viral metagenome TaxID=1070528 RepID=A0A6M3KSY1_9ZZZZ
MAFNAVSYKPVITGELLRIHMDAVGLSLRKLAGLLSAEVGYEIGFWVIDEWRKDGDHVIEPDELYGLQRIFIGILE